MTADTNRTVSGVRLEILEALKRQGKMTVDGLVEKFALSKTAMRAHLLRLEDDEMIERRKIACDGPGRPPLGYCVTDRGGAAFASADSAILTQLLGYLERQGATDLVTDFFEELWSRRLEDFQKALGTKDLDSATLEERLSALEELLSAHDFMPVIEAKVDADGGAKICVRECNCPFPAAVRATRIPCQMETRFLADVLGARTLQTSFASKTSETCAFDFLVEAVGVS